MPLWNAPMLIPLLGLIAGILASLAGAPLWTALLTGAGACAGSFVMSRLTRDPLKGMTRNKWHNGWIFLAFMTVGIADADLNRPYELEDEPDSYTAAQGRVLSVSSKTAGDRAVVQVSRLIGKEGDVTGTRNFKLLVKSDALPCATDDEVLVAARISKIEDSKNYFSGGYRESMARKGILHEAYASGKKVQVIGHRASLTGCAEGIREKLEIFIEKTRLEKSTQNFLITILLGDRDYLDPDMREIFANAGISHMLALSGMHVAIIAGIVLWLLFPINFAGLYRWRMLLACVFILFYAFITGLAPSTVRATLMMLAMMIAMFMERKNAAWNSLLLAVFVILAFSPNAIQDVGLQLSFLCVASLIFFTNPLNPVNHHEHPRLYKFAAMLLTTLVATASTWCVTAWYFGTVPLVFLPANLVALPLLPAYLVASIAYLVLGAAGLELTWLAGVIDWFPSTLVRVIEWMGSGTVMKFSPTAANVWLWLAVVAAAAVLLNGKTTRMRKWVLGACAGLFALSLAFPADAGKGDAFIIQSYYRSPSMLCRQNGEESQMTFERKGVSQCRVADREIMFLDCPVKNIEPARTEILILAGGIRDELPEMLEKVDCSQIVIHPSIRKKREARILHDADSLGIPCHSIRASGPFKYYGR